MNFVQAVQRAGTNGTVWRSPSPAQRYRVPELGTKFPTHTDLIAEDWYGSPPDSLEYTAMKAELEGKIEDLTARAVKAEDDAKVWEQRFLALEAKRDTAHLKATDRVSELEKMIENFYLDAIGFKPVKKT